MLEYYLDVLKFGCVEVYSHAEARDRIPAVHFPFHPLALFACWKARRGKRGHSDIKSWIYTMHIVPFAFLKGQRDDERLHLLCLQAAASLA